MMEFDRELHDCGSVRYRARVRELREKTEALSEANRRLTVIGSIGRDITAALDLGRLMLEVHAAINSLLSTDSLGLGVCDERSQRVEYKFFIEGGERLEPITIDLSSPDSLGACCIRERKNVVIGDMDNEYQRYVSKRPQSFGQKNKSAVYLPLIVRDRAIGLLTVQSQTMHAYGEYEVETLRVLSSYIAVALENSLVHERLMQLNNELNAEKAELERANQIIRHMANHDNLTGLPNRRLLYDLFEKDLPLARRHRSSFVVLYIDLDDFKPVNDEYGHASGDAVLRTIAARLDASVRASDVVARMGGDEFVVVIRDVSNFDAVGATIDKLISSIRQPIELAHGSVVVHASAGASVFPADGENLDQLLLRADEAMYRIKEGDRSRSWAFYRD